MGTRVLRTTSVLLVNEGLEDRERYIRTLQEAGYDAIQAATSAVAFRIAITTPPDVVVTDVRVAGSIGGFELIRRLRSHGRTSALPIIVLTSVSRPYDGNVALEAGANVFLQKPVSRRELTAAIGRLLGVPTREPRDDARRHARSLAAPEAPNPWQERICPRCSGRLRYRERWPVLSPGLPGFGDRIARDRLRYEAGWFCADAACAYEELDQSR